MATTEVKPSANKDSKKKSKGLDFDAYVARQKQSKNPKEKRNPSLAPKKDLKKKKKAKKPKDLTTFENDDEEEELGSEPVTGSEQLSYFFKQLQSATGVQVSSLELEPIKDKCVVELSERLEQDVSNLGEHIKVCYGDSWREALCEGEEIEGKSGNPSALVISSSALRSCELLRGLNSLTKQCPAVKLFSKHLKVEEQVSLLKKRVNIGSGTPSRIKKLIDIEALGLSRLDMIVIDMHPDVKGFSLFTLPQVRDEFWDLYKSCFHQRVLEGSLRICLYGPKTPAPKPKAKKKHRKNQH